ncbi:MAG: hypothetical protein AAB217_01810, partial [Chloroflexota bacterium]
MRLLAPVLIPSMLRKFGQAVREACRPPRRSSTAARTGLRDLLILPLLLAACGGGPPPTSSATAAPPPTQPMPTKRSPQQWAATPLPTRARWQFGDVLPYAVQSGDTL